MEIDVSGMDIESLRALRGRIDAILDGPADKIGSLDEIVAELKAAKDKAASIGKAAIARATRAFMDSHPEVAALSWTQYTPYFNDGDACEFSVREPGVKLAGVESGEGDEDDEDDEEWTDSWSLGYYAEKRGEPKPESLMRDLKDFEKTLDNCEDALKAVFGDHVRVTIRHGATEAEVEEYNHD